MQNFIIKTHRVGTIYSKPHLFVLNKGMNSGKPQKEPFTNSFVIIFQNVEDCENIFFIAYSLWQTKFWHQFLVGSVISFLRLQDFKKQFNPQASLLTKIYTLSVIYEEPFYTATIENKTILVLTD